MKIIITEDSLGFDTDDPAEDWEVIEAVISEWKELRHE